MDRIAEASSNWINKRIQCLHWPRIKLSGSGAEAAFLQFFLKIVYVLFVGLNFVSNNADTTQLLQQLPAQTHRR